MSWRDDLQTVTLSDGRRLIGASFRGVPFFVEQSSRSGGRRTVTHEFPGRDEPYVEDLGRRARAFRVRGYLLGEAYVADRDELLAALEDTAGPGRLVHPYHGIRVAMCTALEVEESRDEGGMAVLSIDFVEAPAQTAGTDTALYLPATVAASADAAQLATAAEFADSFDVDGLPSFALLSAGAALADMAAALGGALAPLVSVTQELARMDQEMDIVVARASSLVRQPGEVLGSFLGVLDQLETTLTEAPATVLRALLDTYGTDTGTLAPALTATRQQEHANHAAISTALRRTLVIQAARLAPTATFETFEEAIALRDEIADLLEEEAATASDTTYPALVQLRADLVRAVPADPELARLVTEDVRVAIPSLALTYRLYGSVEQEADVIARNRIRHPGFVSGELRVLSRGG